MGFSVKKLKKKTKKFNKVVKKTSFVVAKVGKPVARYGEAVPVIGGTVSKAGLLMQDQKKIVDSAYDNAGKIKPLNPFKTVKNPASVSSKYEKTEYQRTPDGLVPVSSSGADETKIATSTLIFGAIALLFLASMMKEK